MQNLLRLAAIITLLALAAPAQAEVYPWCAVYGGTLGSGPTNCGFVTLEQCRATVSGIGGFCQRNPFYDERVRRGRARHRDRD